MDRMNRRTIRFTALGTMVIVATIVIEEAVEPPDYLMPHAEQDDFTPLPFAHPMQWMASGSSIAANSFVSNTLRNRFTFNGFAINSFVPNLMRGPFDDV
jgi:hypothetical protein